MTFPKDIWKSISTFKNPNSSTWKPKAPDKDEKVSNMEESIFNEEINQYMISKRTFEYNTFKLYSIVLGQFCEAIEAKLEGKDE